MLSAKLAFRLLNLSSSNNIRCLLRLTVSEQGQLFLFQISPYPFFKSKGFQRYSPYCRAMQFDAVISCCGKHALDLMIFPLLQHDFQLVCIELPAMLRSLWSWLIMQLHAAL